MKTEKVLTIIFLIGLIFRAFHWQEGEIILKISLMSIFIIYLLAGFYFFCDKTIKQQNLTLSIVSGCFLATVPSGILFSMMHWQGGAFLLLIGVTASPIFLIITLILKNKASENLKLYYKNMLLRTSVLTIISIVVFLILNPIQFSS